MRDLPLSQQYPSLYNIVPHKYELVSTVFANTPLNIYFRSGQNDNKWGEWLHFCRRLISVTLSTESDKFIWELTDSGRFTVKYMFLDLMNDDNRFLGNHL
jgi:hypothetical protein